MAEIPDQLKQVVSEIHLAEIAEKISEWESLVDYLGISDYEAVEIKKNNKDFYKLQKRDFLRKWKQKYGEGATYHCLMEVVKKASSEQHLASFITELLGTELYITQYKNIIVTAWQRELWPLTTPILRAIAGLFMMHLAS